MSPKGVRQLSSPEPRAPEPRGPEPRASEPLRRAIAVFRFASLGYAMLLVGVIYPTSYSRLDWAWAVLAVMTGWTIATTFLYARPGRHTALLLADLMVTAGLLLSTFALQYPHAIRHGVMPVTAIWVAGPVLAWAVGYGRRAGAVTAVVLSACDFVLRDGALTVVLNGAVLLLLAGVIVGHLARLATEVEQERQHVVQVEAASRERERLARDIHDSVLQVLALVQRRGAEAGREAGGTGQPAGQQEAALRAMVGKLRPQEDGARVDVRALLQPLGSERVTVSAPANVVLIERGAAGELTSAVCAALDNVRRHCGERARAWLLVEDEPEVITVTIRDDGPGIHAGRLGIRHPIRGRIGDLGGAATITSVPGEGTEVQLRVPR